jgi:hypothetical protein
LTAKSARIVPRRPVSLQLRGGRLFITAHFNPGQYRERQRACSRWSSIKKVRSLPLAVLTQQSENNLEQKKNS